MSEASLAADGEQETGVRVDLDADDDKAVVRDKPQRKTSQTSDWAARQKERSEDIKKRLSRQARGFNQQLAEQQAAHQRELAEIRGRLDKLSVNREETPAGDDGAHSAAMEKLQAELEEAQERGDSKTVARLTREMSTLEGKYWAAKAAKVGVKEGGQAQGDGSAGAQTQARAAKPTKAGVTWAKANSEWWNDTLDETAIDARAYANSIHARWQNDGEHDPEDPSYFEEIGKLVRQRFPEIEVKSAVRRGQSIDHDDADPPEQDDEDDAGQHRNPRRAAPPQIRDRGQIGRRQNMRTLTKEDMTTMRKIGMDPDNNKHVVQFLRSGEEIEAEA